MICSVPKYDDLFMSLYASALLYFGCSNFHFRSRHDLMIVFLPNMLLLLNRSAPDVLVSKFESSPTSPKTSVSPCPQRKIERNMKKLCLVPQLSERTFGDAFNRKPIIKKACTGHVIEMSFVFPKCI